jgi:hypothetical protein
MVQCLTSLDCSVAQKIAATLGEIGIVSKKGLRVDDERLFCIRGGRICGQYFRVQWQRENLVQ